MTTTQGERQEAPACYRHPKRETYVRCTRCDRYICPDCMREAAVGQQCVECVREGNKTVRQSRTVFGGKVSVTPWATYVLIAVNVLVYLGELAKPDLADKLGSLGMGLIGPDGGMYAADGGTYPGFEAIGVAYGEWYRLITSAFVHLLPTEGGFGILHIVLNMWWLWRLGRPTEEMLGRWRFLALYLLAALGGSVLGYLIDPGMNAIGASGGIFGLTAAYWIFMRRLGHPMHEANRLVVFAMIWLVVSAGITAWQGHLGGLLAGGAIALAFAYAPRERRVLVQAGAAAAMLVLLTALVMIKTSELGGTLL
ncbi:rhomboid family intramembrane serine protease [Actinomadura sp.]|jgi:membrane associated rhomboid family serine protease|uniref:rhomboid family intramembrane serine protease n=1 Tax=Actinomadura sp. TaxID=1989 RepID=UPI0037C5BF1B